MSHIARGDLVDFVWLQKPTGADGRGSFKAKLLHDNYGLWPDNQVITQSGRISVSTYPQGDAIIGVGLGLGRTRYYVKEYPKDNEEPMART